MQYCNNNTNVRSAPEAAATIGKTGCPPFPETRLYSGEGTFLDDRIDAIRQDVTCQGCTLPW